MRKIILLSLLLIGFSGFFIGCALSSSESGDSLQNLSHRKLKNMKEKIYLQYSISVKI